MWTLTTSELVVIDEEKDMYLWNQDVPIEK